MEKFKPGDLITYRLHGDDYGLAQVLAVENLALHNHYHLALLDAIVKGEEEAVDSYGVLYNRRHTLDGAEAAPIVIDHIALTMDALDASDPMKVAERDVRESDLNGYHVWMLTTREDLVRKGLIRDVPPEEQDGMEDDEDLEAIAEEMDEEDLDLHTSTDQVFEDGEGVEEEAEEDTDADENADDSTAQDAEAGMTVELRPWHREVYSEPLDAMLFRLHEEFKRPELKEMTLGAYICSFFDGGNVEAINEMVTRFVEGDYSAGHELLAFGDAAVDALAVYLQDGMEPQLADDILNVLCDSGTMRAYSHIATFFAQHEGNPDDPLGLPAARGYAYAVMLTGGTPEPLREHLSKLEDISFPELEHDVAAAMDAVVNASKAGV